MTPKKKVTDATKAKLPLPKNHPQRKSGKRKAQTAVSVDLDATRKIHIATTPKRVQCPNCEKWIRPGPNDIHTCYDAKALREEEAALLAGSGWTPVSWELTATTMPTSPATISVTSYREPLYDTRPYPWDIRRWMSNKLTALAKWVARD